MTAFPLEKLLLVIAAIGILIAPLVVAPFTVTLLNYIGIGALVALGLVLLTGFAGLTSFGQAALVGVGAYATAWLTTDMGGSPWLGLLLALTLTGIVAAILGAVTLRLGGHFLPLSTVAWGIAIYFLFGNIPGLGYHDGIKEIPPLSLAGVSLASNSAIYYLIWIALGGSMWLIANLLNSREGRAVRSLRGGAAMIASLGVNLFRIRLIIFVLAAILAGLAGWLYAHMNRYVSPSPFDVRPSIEYLLMAMVGGANVDLRRRGGGSHRHAAQKFLSGVSAALIEGRRPARDRRLQHSSDPDPAARARRPDVGVPSSDAATARAAPTARYA